MYVALTSDITRYNDVVFRTKDASENAEKERVFLCQGGLPQLLSRLIHIDATLLISPRSTRYACNGL